MSQVSPAWFRVVEWTGEDKTGPYPTIDHVKANVFNFPSFATGEKLLSRDPRPAWPDAPIEVTGLYLGEDAILRDAILEGTHMQGSVWYVSSKLKALLASFRLPIHAFYKITRTMQKGKDVAEDYYVFHVLEDVMDMGLIDYTRSRFKTVPYTSFLMKGELPYETIIASSQADYRQQSKEQSNQLNNVQPLSLVFKKSLNYDLFGIWTNDYFVSARLAEAMQQQHITGIDLVPADFEILVP